MSKWKKRYFKLLDASQCRNVIAELEVDRLTGEVFLKYRHQCGIDCDFLRALRDE